MSYNIIKANTKKLEMSEGIEKNFDFDPLFYFNCKIDEVAIGHIHDIVRDINGPIKIKNKTLSDGQGTPLFITIEDNLINIKLEYSKELMINISVNKKNDSSTIYEFKIFNEKKQLKEKIEITKELNKLFEINHKNFNSKGVLINQKTIKKNSSNILAERDHILTYEEEKLIKKIVTETHFNLYKEKIYFLKKTENIVSGKTEEIEEHYDGDSVFEKYTRKFEDDKKVKETQFEYNLPNDLKKYKKTEKTFDDLDGNTKEVISFYDSSSDKLQSKKKIERKFDNFRRVTEETIKIYEPLENFTKIKIKTKWDYVNRVIEIRKVYHESQYSTDIEKTKKYYDEKGLLIKVEEKKINKNSRGIEQKKLKMDLVKEYSYDSSGTKVTMIKKDKINGSESKPEAQNIEPAETSFIHVPALSFFFKEIKSFFDFNNTNEKIALSAADNLETTSIPQNNINEGNIVSLAQSIGGFYNTESNSHNMISHLELNSKMKTNPQNCFTVSH